MREFVLQNKSILLLELLLVLLVTLYFKVTSLLILGLLLVVLLGVHPFINIFVLIFMMAFREITPGISIGAFSIAPIQLVVLISVFYVIVDVVTGEQFHIPFRNNIFFRLILIFYFICFLSVFQATDKRESIRFLRDLFFFLLVAFYIVSFIRTEGDLKKVVDYWIFSAVVVSVLGIVQLMFNLDYYSLLQLEHRWRIPQDAIFFRINSTFRDPNFLANFLLFPLLMLISELNFTGSRKRVFYLVIIFTAFMMTASRGAILSFIMGLFLIYSWKYWGKVLLLRIVKFALLLGVIGVLVVKLFPHVIFERFFISQNNVDWSSIYRLFYLYIGVKVIMANFWFGVGINNFPIVFKKYTPEVIWLSLTQGGQENVLHGGGYAHNTLLTIWAETGVFNFVTIVVFVVYLARFLMQIRKEAILTDEQKALYVGIIVGFAAIGLHILTLTYLTYHIFLNVGLIIVSYSIFHNRTKKQKGLVTDS